MIYSTQTQQSSLIMSRTDRIHAILTKELQPEVLIIDDESNQHRVPDNAESHFKLTLACTFFDSLSVIQRHRTINHLLEAEFKQGLHALSLHLYTPGEWKQRSELSPHSPPCQHVDKTQVD